MESHITISITVSSVFFSVQQIFNNTCFRYLSIICYVNCISICIYCVNYECKISECLWTKYICIYLDQLVYRHILMVAPGSLVWDGFAVQQGNWTWIVVFLYSFDCLPLIYVLWYLIEGADVLDILFEVDKMHFVPIPLYYFFVLHCRILISYL